MLNCVQKPLESIAAQIFAARQHNLAHGQVGASCLSPENGKIRVSDMLAGRPPAPEDVVELRDTTRKLMAETER